MKVSHHAEQRVNIEEKIPASQKLLIQVNGPKLNLTGGNEQSLDSQHFHVIGHCQVFLHNIDSWIFRRKLSLYH